MDLINLFYSLFNHHYPGIIAQVFILNYGWMHAGIWSIVKQALPSDAHQKLVFLSKKDLLSYITYDRLPKG